MSQELFNAVATVVVVALMVWGVIAKIRRRARMSPEERAMDDVATELRRTRRELRRHHH